MSGGDIAGIIAASAFALLVIFMGIPLLKLGRVLEETRHSIRDLNESMGPLLSELTETVESANRQLAKVDIITQKAAEVSTNVSSLVALFSATVGAPLIKIAGLTQTIKSAIVGKSKKK